MPNKTDDSTTLDTPHQEQDGQQLVDRLEHELQENPDPELVERVVQSPILKQTFIAEMHQGPLPPAHAMADYDRVLPGAAERIMQMAEREQSHRHSVQQEQLTQSKFLATSYMQQDTLGKKMGFSIAVLVLAIACLMALLGHEVLAGILAGLDLVGLSAVFVIGKVLSRDDSKNTEKTG